MRCLGIKGQSFALSSVPKQTETGFALSESHWPETELVPLAFLEGRNLGLLGAVWHVGFVLSLLGNIWP